MDENAGFDMQVDETEVTLNAQMDGNNAKLHIRKVIDVSGLADGDDDEDDEDDEEDEIDEEDLLMERQISANEKMEIEGDPPEPISLVGVNNIFVPLQKRRHISQSSPPSSLQLNTNGSLLHPISPHSGPNLTLPCGDTDHPDDDNGPSPPTVLNRGTMGWLAQQPLGPPKLEEMDDVADLYDDDDEAKPSGSIEFKVSNISQLKDQALSPPVMIRCLPWKILVMCKSQNGGAVATNDRSTKNLGFFVQCNAESPSTTWNCHAKAELRIVAQKSGCSDHYRQIEHNFFHKENDWGFANFMLYTDLFNPEKGYIGEDDSLILKAKVIADAPHGVDWDSKRHTGFVGLKNQGATCYMNSLLQALYCTNKLRKAVYLMPTDSDDASRSVPLGLQRVFYELQYCDRVVGTKKLTRSFGWETLDTFMQHDAQELCRVLMDNMENTMKGTSVEDTLPSLFRGKMLSYIKCKNVNFESKREENFYDIQLKVKGNANVYDAFNEYVAVESLDAENKYDAGDYGLQDAEKGVSFLKFPPVLYLQLMRFQYDHMADSNAKINDRFEFPYHLNLERYVREGCESPTKYFLHSVLVHSGDNHGGHYVVYINPKGDNKWYKFDDDVVSRCSRREAILLNYGSCDEEMGVKSCTNAYMLVYIAECTREEVLCPVLDEDIPDTLRQKFAHEHAVEAQKRHEKAEAHLYAHVHIFLDEDFDGWQGYDLYNSDTVPVRRLRVPKAITRSDFVQLLADTLNQPVERIWPWLIQPRKTHALRVVYLDSKDNLFQNDNLVNVWVQTLPPDDPLPALPPFDMDQDLIIFFKFYEPRTHSIHYCGSMIIRLHTPLTAILPELRRRANLGPEEPLLLFEEKKVLCVTPILRPELKIEDCVEQVMDGNILVFQVDIPNNKETADAYFDDYYYRTEVICVDKSRLTDPGFPLILSTKLTYCEITQHLANFLNTTPDLIQLLRMQLGLQNREPPYVAVRCCFDGTLKDLISSVKGVKRLFYQRLTLPITEMENMRQLRCVFLMSNFKEVDVTLSLSKTSTVTQLLEEAKQKVELSATGSGKLRLIEVMSSKISQEFPGDMKISALPSHSSSRLLRIEEIPVDELELEDNESVINVAHFHRECYQTFGVPFTLKIRDGEFFSNVRERIRRRLGVPEKEFERWRFAVVGTRASYLPDDAEATVRINLFNASPQLGVTQPPILPPQQTGLALATNANNIPAPPSPLPPPSLVRPWLGLEHKFPTKRARYTFTEKPIKIHN